jgi:integrase
VYVERVKPTRYRQKAFYEQERALILKAAYAINEPNTPDEAARRWVPWLLYYTGARPGEITQLRGIDIKCIDAVWALDLTPDAGTIKDNDARLVPLHSHLIEQGFLEFVQSRGDGPLFYRPRRTKSDSSALLHQKKSPAAQVRQRLAKWLRKDVGLGDGYVSPLHAWRHTFKLIGRRVEENEALVDYICGHAPASVGRSYGEADLQDLKRFIEKFPRFDVVNEKQVNEEVGSCALQTEAERAKERAAQAAGRALKS